MEDNWINIEDALPKATKNFYNGHLSKWVLCATDFGAILLSLCRYDHNDKNWYDHISQKPEERIKYWQPVKPPKQIKQ